MPSILPLEKMTMIEKISTMELLWESIARDSKNYQSPEWHGDILEQREEMRKKGEAVFEDWEKVKDELWNDLT
jgi:hypothetical protein